VKLFGLNFVSFVLLAKSKAHDFCDTILVAFCFLCLLLVAACCGGATKLQKGKWKESKKKKERHAKSVSQSSEWNK